MIRRILFTLALLACLGLTRRAAAQHAEAPEAGAGAGAGATHSTEHDAAAGEGHGGYKRHELLPEAGDPQTLYAAVWVLVIFVVMLAILYPTAWKNVLAGLKAREDRIRRDIALPFRHLASCAGPARAHRRASRADLLCWMRCRARGRARSRALQGVTDVSVRCANCDTTHPPSMRSSLPLGCTPRRAMPAIPIRASARRRRRR